MFRDATKSAILACSGLLTSDELQRYVVGLREPQSAVEGPGGRVIAGGYKLYQGCAVLAGDLSHALDQEPPDSITPVILVYHQGRNLDDGIAVGEVWFDPEHSDPFYDPVALGEDDPGPRLLDKFGEAVPNGLASRVRIPESGGKLARETVHGLGIHRLRSTQPKTVCIFGRFHEMPVI